MTDEKPLHILPREGGWAIKRENTKRAIRVLPTKELAVEHSKRISKGETVLFVHDTDGKIKKGFVPRKYKSISVDELSKLSTNRIHVVPREDDWAVKRENRKQPSKTFSKKYQAIRHAHEQADRNGVSMVIHNKDGTIHHIDLPPHYQSPVADLLHLR